MGHIENISRSEAYDKLLELAENKMCMLCSRINEQLDSRPMATQGIDNDGTFWFFSKAGSNKNHQIESNPAVELIYSNSGSDSYLFVNGIAIVMRDQEVIDRLWSPFAKTWFDKGKDDPSLTLIKVVPNAAHYWDTKHGKMVSTLKILFSAITGASMDDGREGDITL